MVTSNPGEIRLRLPCTNPAGIVTTVWNSAWRSASGLEPKAARDAPPRQFHGAKRSSRLLDAGAGESSKKAELERRDTSGDLSQRGTLDVGAQSRQRACERARVHTKEE